MAAPKAMKHRLIEQRDQLLREMEALRNKIAGLELAIALIESDSKSDAASTKVKEPARGSVKGTILDLLREVGTTGLNGATAVELASRRGIVLDRASVSSLLSRLKKEQVIVLDGAMYKLPEFVRAIERPTLTLAVNG